MAKTAVLCLGHLARIHGKIDELPTVTFVRSTLLDADEWVPGQAESAADDIEIFVPEIGRKIRAD